MDFLSSLQFDVKLLLVGGAVALFAALMSASKKNEHRFMALFTVLMLVAGVRFQQGQSQDEQAAVRADATVNSARGAGQRR